MRLCYSCGGNVRCADWCPGQFSPPAKYAHQDRLKDGRKISFEPKPKATWGDPATCAHPRLIERAGGRFCTLCGKQQDGPGWIVPEAEPGYAERVAQASAARKERERARQEREDRYDLSGVCFDEITTMSSEDLERLRAACAEELAWRAEQPKAEA